MYPVLFQVGPFTAHFYGFMYVIALLVGIWMLRPEAARRGLPPDQVVPLVFWAFVVGVLGGRIYFIIFHWDYFTVYPSRIIAIWRGGMAIHGGLIGGFLGAWLYARFSGLSYVTLCDAAAPIISLTHAIGRFGNFMNGGAHGYPLHAPELPAWLRHFPDWIGVTFLPISPAGKEFGQVPLHPVQLYELVLNLIGFVLLWNLRKKPFPPGGLIGLYLMYYAMVRSVTSLFRADDLYLGPFRMPHVISLVMFATGLLLWLWPRRDHQTAR